MELVALLAHALAVHQPTTGHVNAPGIQDEIELLDEIEPVEVEMHGLQQNYHSIIDNVARQHPRQRFQFFLEVF